MIETEEFTMAESKEEAFWIETKKRYELNLEVLKKDVVFVEAIIKMCGEHIKNETTKP